MNDYTYLIDLKPKGLENFSASYVIKGNRASIIETGPTLTVGNLLAGLKEIGVKREEVDYVAVTHIHIDHAGGAGTLLPHLPNAKLLVHKKGARHLINPERLWISSLQVLGDIAEMYGKFQPVPEERILIAKEGMVLDLGEDIDLTVLEVPGHASHELSFYEKNSNGIFPGDAAGTYLNKFDMVSINTPPPFHLEMALSSLQRLIQMKPRWLYYSHFGPADDAVKKLKNYAARLKLWGEIILEEMKRGESLDVISERILEKDPLAPDVVDYIKNHPIFSRGIIIGNVYGFMEYFRKSMT
ncbi:MAG: Hydroxyacylglutathione hydrolase [Candidatus Bathyarchaeota archaeon BA2]|nr:MAG: Hydroxyacylglutathione hydrolase [Candidatus Bathyarchaeota archaeon BA2]